MAVSAVQLPLFHQPCAETATPVEERCGLSTPVSGVQPKRAADVPSVLDCMSAGGSGSLEAPGGAIPGAAGVGGTAALLGATAARAQSTDWTQPGNNNAVIDLQKTKVDLMTFTAHKTYGPKGVGALYVCRKARARMDNGSRVDRHHLIAHMNSASVATSPATRATPLNFQILRIVRTISASRIN